MAKTSTRTSRPAPASIDPVEPYARVVLDGKMPAGRLVRLACQRHLRDLVEGPARGLHWDRAAALYAIRFFRFLRHSKGEWAGQVVQLAPWQQFIVGSVFGWKTAHGTRRFRTVHEEVPRKNGKSTMLAGIGLYCLVADGEPGAEVYAAATKKDQARIIFGEAQRMVRRSAPLAGIIDVFKLNLSVEATASKFEPLSSDDKTADGLNPSAVLIDELHRHRTRALLDVLDTALGARRQPLLWIITTAGEEGAETVYAQEHDYARKVVEGLIEDDTLFAYIATSDEGDDVFDPATWAKVNPNLGISVKLDDMRRQAEKARKSPSALNAFKRLRLNIRTSETQHAFGAELWMACGAPVDVDSLRGRKCYAGLDLSAKNDLTALVLVFDPVEDGAPADVLPFFWVPAHDLPGREDRDRVPYALWRDQGFINTVEGKTIDYGWVAEKIGTLAAEYDIQGIAFDRWRIDDLLRELARAGVDAWIDTGKVGEEISGAVRLLPWGQGFKDMNPAAEALEDALLDGRLRHGKHPVLTWNAANAVLQQDPAGLGKFAKNKSTGRIDGVVALAMALGLAVRRPTPERSMYETVRLAVA